ncbi:MAG: hypothetical protein ACJKTH_01390 [Patescibacteria group bacterium UBA2163]
MNNARQQLVLAVVLLGLSIAFLQHLASMYYLYWIFWWYDIIMHLLGGAFVALLFFWAHRAFPVLPMSRQLLFPVTLLVVLIIGILWEVFEYVTGSYGAVNYTLDTTLDLAMDIAGMMSAYILFKRYV